MYLGHGFLAFALVGTAGLLLDLDRDRTLLLAALAGGFGLLPDIDMWRTGYVYLRSGPQGLFPTEEYLWAHSWVVHRTLTHSLVTGAAVAVVAAVAAGPSARPWSAPEQLAGAFVVLGGLGLCWFAVTAAGVAGLVTMLLFVGAAIALARIGHHRGARPRGVLAVAAVGILTHPFGDLWMGRPPAFLYPLWDDPPLSLVTFSPDPTLHFLAAIAIELVLLWWCLAIGCLATGRRLRTLVSPVAAVGVAAVVALGRVPDPSFAEAYQFVVGLVVLAGLAAALVWRFDHGGEGYLPRRLERPGVSGVAAFSLGLVSFAVAYAVVG